MKLKFRHVSAIFATVALTIAGMMLEAQAPAKHVKQATAQANKTRGEASGTDDEIKKDRHPNDPNSKLEAPPEKGGPKTRGGDVCRLHIDNRTRWYINVYTDGDYRGEVSPFGDLQGWVGCGETKFYGKANFDDGSSKTWGPSSYFVDGAFTWTLHY